MSAYSAHEAWQEALHQHPHPHAHHHHLPVYSQQSPALLYRKYPPPQPASSYPPLPPPPTADPSIRLTSFAADSSRADFHSHAASLFEQSEDAEFPALFDSVKTDVDPRYAPQYHQHPQQRYADEPLKQSYRQPYTEQQPVPHAYPGHYSGSSSFTSPPPSSYSSSFDAPPLTQSARPFHTYAAAASTHVQGSAAPWPSSPELPFETAVPHRALSHLSSSPPAAVQPASALASPAFQVESAGSTAPPLFPLSTVSTSTTNSSPSSPSSSRTSPPSPDSPSAASHSRPLLSTNPALARRLKHREIDAVRKLKETALLRELEALTLTEEERRERGEAAVPRLEAARSADPKDKKRARRKRVRDSEGGGGGEEKRKEKLAVLQASVRRIKELEDKCQRITALCTTQNEDSMQRWGDFFQRLGARHGASSSTSPSTSASSSSSSSSSPLLRLPPSACDCLTFLSHQHALYTSSFIHTNLCFALAAVPTGFILDANTPFLSFTHWLRDDILHHTFTKPYVHPLLAGDGPIPRVSPFVRGGRGGTRWLEDKVELPQYPRSRESKALLLTGQVKTINETWLSRMGDGRVYSFDATSWISRWEDVWVEKVGQSIRVPVELSMMFDGREDRLVEEIPPLGIEEEPLASDGDGGRDALHR